MTESSNPLTPYSAEVTFKTVNPEMLALLTGQRVVDGKFAPVEPTFAVEVFHRTPVRRRAWRVVWEFITRQPRRYHEHYTYFPNARIEEQP